jgi:hypothetical protein
MKTFFSSSVSSLPSLPSGLLGVGNLPENFNALAGASGGVGVHSLGCGGGGKGVGRSGGGSGDGAGVGSGAVVGGGVGGRGWTGLTAGSVIVPLKTFGGTIHRNVFRYVSSGCESVSKGFGMCGFWDIQVMTLGICVASTAALLGSSNVGPTFTPLWYGQHWPVGSVPFSPPGDAFITDSPPLLRKIRAEKNRELRTHQISRVRSLPFSSSQ